MRNNKVINGGGGGTLLTDFLYFMDLLYGLLTAMQVYHSNTKQQQMFAMNSKTICIHYPRKTQLPVTFCREKSPILCNE